jgi:hypothetical protein
MRTIYNPPESKLEGLEISTYGEFSLVKKSDTFVEVYRYRRLSRRSGVYRYLGFCGHSQGRWYPLSVQSSFFCDDENSLHFATPEEAAEVVISNETETT